MNRRTFAPLVSSLFLSFSALLLLRFAGELAQSSAPRAQAKPAPPVAPSHNLRQSFHTEQSLEPIDVEIVALSLSGSGLPVGGSVQLQAQTSPPVQAPGALSWSILSGRGTIQPQSPFADVVSLTLHSPGPISHDTPGIVVGVQYQSQNRIVSDTLSVPLDEALFLQPFIQNYTLHFPDGKLFPEPGDVVTLSLQHALPHGYTVLSEDISPITTSSDLEAMLPVTVTAQAMYLGPVASFFDVHTESFQLPFSPDRDSNGTPDIVDAQFSATLTTLAGLPVNPSTADVWRAPKALVAQMIRTPFWAFPAFTFDPNCERSTFGYYQWNGSKVNDLQFCPKAFVTPLQFWVTLCHEMKHWWDEKIVGVHQDHKDVERFGWLCGTLIWPLWTDKDEEIFDQMDPPIGPPLTFNVAWGSSITWTLTLTNANSTYPIGTVQVRLKSLMSSGGHYATGDILGGGISVGANGLVDTAATSGDVQLIPVGQGRPHAIVVQPGPNGVLDTSPSGDDVLFPSEEHLTSGANGIVETTAQGDDVQVISVGRGYTSTTYMPLGVAAGPDGTVSSTLGGDDQLMPPPALPISNLQIAAPSSIAPAAAGTITIAFDVVDSMPGSAAGTGVIHLVFEMTGDQGGGLRRETFEAFVYLLPKLYLPLIMKASIS